MTYLQKHTILAIVFFLQGCDFIGGSQDLSIKCSTSYSPILDKEEQEVTYFFTENDFLVYTFLGGKNDQDLISRSIKIIRNNKNLLQAEYDYGVNYPVFTIGIIKPRYLSDFNYGYKTIKNKALEDSSYIVARNSIYPPIDHYDKNSNPIVIERGTQKIEARFDYLFSKLNTDQFDMSSLSYNCEDVTEEDLISLKSRIIRDDKYEE